MDGNKKHYPSVDDVIEGVAQDDEATERARTAVLAMGQLPELDSRPVTDITKDMPIKEAAGILAGHFAEVATTNDLLNQTEIQTVLGVLKDGGVTGVTATMVRAACKQAVVELKEAQAEEQKQRASAAALGEAARRPHASWRDQLTVGQNGEPSLTRRNALIALRNHPTLAKSCTWDLVTEKAMFDGPVPWDSQSRGRQLLDQDIGDISQLLEEMQAGNYSVRNPDLFDAILTLFRDRSVNRAKDDFEAVQWDGVPRLNMAPFLYLGACPPFPERNAVETESEHAERLQDFNDRCEFISAAFRKFMIAMCRRVYQPGCKVDTVLVLRGAQGIKKSTFCADLAPGGAEYFANNPPAFDGRPFQEWMKGKTLCELGELAHLSRASAGLVKSVIVTQVDRYRKAYGRLVEDIPRSCVFVATTNENEFLSDDTGNRRWWVLDAGTYDREAFLRDRAQLFAEARAAMVAGETHWFDEHAAGDHPDAAAMRGNKAAQRSAEKQDAWHETVKSYVSTRDKVTIKEVLDHISGIEGGLSGNGSIPLGARKGPETARVSSILKKLGFKNQTIRLNGVVVQGWAKKV